MAEASQYIEQSQEKTSHHTAGPITRQLAVSLTVTNYIAQDAGGSAISETGGFTDFSPGRLPKVVLGVGGANPTVYTITGTDIYTGAVITEDLTAAGASTVVATQPYATITAWSSDVDPVGTSDLQAGDTWVHPPARACHVGVAGNIACRLRDDSADATLVAVPNGECPREMRIIRTASTTATDLMLGW